MSKIAYIKDVNNDSIFAVLVESGKKTTAFGVSPTARAWAKQSNVNKYSIDDIKKNIDIMLYVSQLKNFAERDADSLADIVDSESLKQISELTAVAKTPVKVEIKSEREPSFEDFQPESVEEDDDWRLSISDAPIHYIDVQFKREAITYKAKAFALDMTVASMRLEAKGARAIFDASARGGVGAWRCPPDSPYGGQFSNRFGRGCTWGVSRRLGRAFTAYAGNDLGKIRKIGEGLERFGDSRLTNAGERSNRRLDRRAQNAARPPARERVADRFATALENAAGGVRSRSANRIQRRTNRRTGGPTQTVKPTKTPKPKSSPRDDFWEDLKKRNAKLSLEDANQIFNTSTPNNGWLVRDQNKSDQEWLDDIESIVKDNPDGSWVAIPDDQLAYVAMAVVDNNMNPTKRDFRKAIAEYRKNKQKPSKRQQRGSSPKKPPLSERLGERIAAAGDNIRNSRTTRTQRGRKPRSTGGRRERAGRVMSQYADRALTGKKINKSKKTKPKKSPRSARRDVVLGGTNTSKFFAKNRDKAMMPDMSTLTQQQQDDVKAAVQEAYEALYDTWEKRTLQHIDRQKKFSRIGKKPARKFKSTPGNLDMDEVAEANQKSGIIDGYMQGQWNNDAHNFEVLAEIVNSGDYSKVDDLKPAKRDRILIAAGVTPPPKRTRGKKNPPATPPSNPPTPPTPPTPPAPRTPPAAPPTPAAPPAPTPTPAAPSPAPAPAAPTPAAPTPAAPTPTPPPARPKPAPTNARPSAVITPTPPPAKPIPTPPAKPAAPKNRDLTIPGVQPAGSTWMGQDVSGLVRLERIGAEPLFLDPSSNRFVDFSDNIEIENPAEAIPRVTYPKVSKTPLIKYPSKRDATKGQNREIFPGVSDKAWDSWSDSVQQFSPDVAYFGESIHGFQTMGDYLSLVLGEENINPDTVIDGTRNLQPLRDMLGILDSFLRPTRSGFLTDDQRAKLSFDYDSARAAIDNVTSVPITVRDIIPEEMFNFPLSSNPFESWNKYLRNDASSYYFTRSAFNTYTSWRATTGTAPSRAVSHSILKALITGDDTDYIVAYDSLLAATLQAQTSMDNLIQKFRTPGNKQSAVETRRMAQLGFEIDALERMADQYFSDDRISAAVTRRKRAMYRRGIDGQNRQRERVELREAGELKVGGKLQLEDLRPQDGVVRDGDKLRQTLEQHRSAQLFGEVNLLDTTQAVPVLTDNEIEYLDQVQEAYLESLLPDGTKVTWADRTTNKSIAELYMALELNGFNDPPLQVSVEEAEQMIKEKDEAGRPRWFLMTRYLKQNPNEPGKSPSTMVDEYREGTRFPIGHGASAGGRGDNFAGGTGYQSYGPAAIVALVSSDSRIADRRFLATVEGEVQQMIRQMADARQVQMGSYTPTKGEIMDIADLMTSTDTIKGTIDLSVDNYQRNPLAAGSPLGNEATAIVFTLVEHWLQLEIAKIDNPSTEADKAWNTRLINMQTGIYNMDEAQIAIFAGYDGYFSDTPAWLSGSAEHSDWPLHTGANFDGQHMMWLNRTALAVLDHTSDFNEADRLSRL